MAKKKSPIELLKHKIESEGFDYCFSDYSEWDEIEDPEFHTLRQAYIEAKNALEERIDNLEEHEEDESIDD